MHMWDNQGRHAEVDVVPAESVNDQEVSHHPGDAHNQDDDADGVVGVVRDVHRGERVAGNHGALWHRMEENIQFICKVQNPTYKNKQQQQQQQKRGFSL